MRCVIEPDLAAFAERVMPLLMRRRIPHGLLLSMIELRLDGTVADEVPPVCAYAHDGGEVVGIALRTPPWPVALSLMPEAAVPLLEEATGGVDPDAPGVSGPAEPTTAFARCRAARTGGGYQRDRRLRLYALEHLRPPREVSGAARRPRPEDTPLLVEWWAAFAADSPVAIDPAGAVERRRSTGELWLWEDAGRPVAFAGYIGPQAGLARVGPVYTPPEHRRRGYGAAVSAAATRGALDRGADPVTLYADLDFPTSNSIYLRIGYRPVLDAVEYRLTAAPGHPAG